MLFDPIEVIKEYKEKEITFYKRSNFKWPKSWAKLFGRLFSVELLSGHFFSWEIVKISESRKKNYFILGFSEMFPFHLSLNVYSFAIIHLESGYAYRIFCQKLNCWHTIKLAVSTFKLLFAYHDPFLTHDCVFHPSCHSQIFFHFNLLLLSVYAGQFLFFFFTN